jgi:hypothetical protein
MQRQITPRRWFSFCALLALSAALLTGPASGGAAAAPASASKLCNVQFGSEAIDTAVILERRRVSCHAARRVVRTAGAAGGRRPGCYRTPTAREASALSSSSLTEGADSQSNPCSPERTRRNQRRRPCELLCATRLRGPGGWRAARLPALASRPEASPARPTASPPCCWLSASRRGSVPGRRLLPTATTQLLRQCADAEARSSSLPA